VPIYHRGYRRRRRRRASARQREVKFSDDKLTAGSGSFYIVR